MRVKRIETCRLCGKRKLTEIIDLGEQKLTGVFPKKNEEVEGGRLRLVKCTSNDGCGLVQLDRSFEKELMYGDNYGYRSGLNNSMVRHLRDITESIVKKGILKENDVVLDIGCNDGTLLGTYKEHTRLKINKIGMDPTGNKFKEYYDDDITLVSEFFSDEGFFSVSDKKAKAITSIAMFYDLEDPVYFSRMIRNTLSDDGIWIMEQSYFPSMIDTCSYDTICHEHIEYYSLLQISIIAEKAGLRIIDVSLSDVNGGSFLVTLCKKEAGYKKSESVDKLKESEISRKVNSLEFTKNFVENVIINKQKLMQFLNEQKRMKKKVLGYGASTKGNVVLQYCGISSELLACIAEVNTDKYGNITPGTGIPIVSESDAKSMNPDYFLVLPWHFKDNILEREKEYRNESGCRFVFALPFFEVI